MGCSYIARYLVHRTAESALHFTYSFKHHLNFSGKHSAMLQLLYIAMYSFIQLSELDQRGVSELVQGSKRQQEDSNPEAPATMVPCSTVLIYNWFCTQITGIIILATV